MLRCNPDEPVALLLLLSMPTSYFPCCSTTQLAGQAGCSTGSKEYSLDTLLSQVGGWPKAPSLSCPLLPIQLGQHICTINSNGDKWVHIHLWQYNKCIFKGDSGFPAGQSQLWLQEKGKSPWRILVLVETTECSKWWPEAIMNLQHRGLRKSSKWKEKALAEKHNKWFKKKIVWKGQYTGIGIRAGSVRA